MSTTLAVSNDEQQGRLLSQKMSLGNATGAHFIRDRNAAPRQKIFVDADYIATQEHRHMAKCRNWYHDAELTKVQNLMQKS
jgi:hypothetical protein